MAEYSQPIRKSPRSGQKIDKAEWGGPEWIASLSRPSDRGDIATWPHRAANQGAGEWVLERWKAGEVRANQGVGPPSSCLMFYILQPGVCNRQYGGEELIQVSENKSPDLYSVEVKATRVTQSVVLIQGY